MKQVLQRFLKGISRRFSVQNGDDPNRLYTLQNARLQKRGETADITRIAGATQLINDTYTDVLDILAYEDSVPVLLVLYKSGTTIGVDRITITAPAKTTLGTFTLANAATVTNSKLLQLEDTILLSPHNKQLNYINGVWYLNDFVSTTPTLTAAFSGGAFATGTITVDTPAPSTAAFATGEVTVNGISDAGYAIGSIDVTTMDAGSGTYVIDIEGTVFSESFLVDGAVDSPSDTAILIRDAINGTGGGATMYLSWEAELDPLDNTKVIVRSLSVVGTLTTFNLTITLSSGTNAFNSTVVDPVGGGSGVYYIRITPLISDNFTVAATDSVATIVGKIVTAVNAGSFGGDIQGEWNASNTSPSALLTALMEGDGFNNQEVEIVLDSGQDVLDATGSVTFGGADEGLPLFSLTFDFEANATKTPYFVSTGVIVGAETANSIATKIQTALVGSSEFNADYTASVLTNVVTVTAKNRGTEYNRTLVAANPATETYVTVAGISGGLVVGGNLRQDTDYHYKARYVYFDGHTTATCYPQLIKTTTTSRQVGLTITTVQDLDGSNKRADIEIFRREEGGAWFLIDRVTPSDGSSTYSYTDNGATEIAALDEQAYVWQDNYQTHEIVRDRYVRANNDYADRGFTSAEFGVTVTETAATNLGNGDDILPPNTIIDVFAQARYTDGLNSFHTKVGTVNVGDEQSKLTVTQNGALSGVKEVAYFASIKQTTDETAVIPFNSVEIYNSNVPSLATRGLSEALQDKPANPHVFLGFKFIGVHLNYTFSLIDPINGVWRCRYNNSDFRVRDEDWDSSKGVTQSGNGDDVALADPFTFDIVVGSGFDFVMNNGTREYELDLSDKFPNYIFVNVEQRDNGTNFGQVLTYRLKYVDPILRFYTVFSPDQRAIVTYPSAVYELAILDSLKESVRQGKLQLSLTSSTRNLSSLKPNSDFINAVVNVVGVLDTSETESEEVYTEDEFLFSTDINHVYLILQSGSVFDDFDSLTANNVDVLGDYDGGYEPIYTSVYSFNLKNVRETNFNGATTVEEFDRVTPTPLFPNEVYQKRTHDYGLTSTQGVASDLEGVVYLGTEPDIAGNTANTPRNLGFTFEKTNKFAFYKLKPSNIYETLIQESDLQNFQTDFPNQVTWSESYLRGSNANGTRNFTFSNFLNIERTYGEIVQLAYVLDKLLVFCKRGVAVVDVGEVISRQSGGNVVVDSSTLLNGYFFTLRNLVDVKAKSVVKYENMLFFGDGLDVWMYDGSFKNISNGDIVLAKNATWIGAIDPFNKEYVITDGTSTFAYSIELQQWYGTYSFTGDAYTTYQDRMFGELGGKVVEHNLGTTMNGTDYTTVIEGIANDLQAPSDVKLWRKFLIEADNASSATFKYGKAYDTLRTKLFSAVESKNGMYHFGVEPRENNSTKIFWRVETTNNSFVLRMLAMIFSLRNRR